MLVHDDTKLTVVGRWLVIADRLHEQEALALVHARQTLHVFSRYVDWYVLPRFLEILVDHFQSLFEIVEALALNVAKKSFGSIHVMQFSQMEKTVQQ